MSRLYLWCLCFVSKIPSPPPQTMGGEEAAKIEDIPPYCTWTLYTGPPGRGQWGSWHIPGSLLGRGGVLGSITREVGPGATTLLLDTDHCFLVLASFLVPSLVPVHSQQHLPTWLSLPPPSWPQRAPSWFLGSLCSPPGSEIPRGYGFSATSPGALSLMFTRGKGCVCWKQLYKYGAGTPPESLG